ncbi:hypothetical protein CKAN_00308900 [Cinnamomum micranthum f. kanehirae]|uniref:Uncharacterized protein n=1 Tax=Cinnamomum micranthum f. kanehirae TaxID=337451 RepID=A0A3S3N8J0_9MAGN|nr:hypothetical protein CKAN_00308900 [Cinnamomum micranthum f. kanehirae]
MTMILCDFDGSGLLSPERQAHKPKIKPVFSFVYMMSTSVSRQQSQVIILASSNQHFPTTHHRLRTDSDIVEEVGSGCHLASLYQAYFAEQEIAY